MNKYGNDFGSHGLELDTFGMPEEVAKHINSHVCHGGGGGRSTTTTSLDPDIKAAVLPALGDVTERYMGGEFNNIADQSGSRIALQKQQDLASQTLEQGLGAENLLNELQNTEGSLLAASQGSLGSSRADRGRQGALLDRSMQLSQADLQTKQQAADALGNVAGQERQLTQEQIDAPLRGAERYFGMLAGAPQGTQTTQTGGGK